MKIYNNNHEAKAELVSTNVAYKPCQFFLVPEKQYINTHTHTHTLILLHP